MSDPLGHKLINYQRKQGERKPLVYQSVYPQSSTTSKAKHGTPISIHIPSFDQPGPTWYRVRTVSVSSSRSQNSWSPFLDLLQWNRTSC